jgi:hypothetical protein
MKPSDRQESLLFGTRPPAAPATLKTRVFAAARRAFREPRPSLTDRLWSNRQLRLAWGLAVVALVLVNLYVTGSPTPAGSEQAAPPSSLAWRWVSDEDQLQVPARRSRPSGLSLQELEKLLIEGLPHLSSAGEKAAQEG